MIRRFALIALLLCTCARDRETALRPEQSQAIDRLIASQMKAYRIPSAAVAVIRNGVVVKEVAVGATKSTPFQLASTTKSFAATGVLLLVRDGRFTLDSRVGDLLDGLPPSWRGVTVRQLLSHTSGLPDIVRTPGQLDLIADTWEQALPLVAQAPHPFPPGGKWAYTQTNYVLLAQLIERHSGKPLETFLHDRLFQPLGMKDTFYPSDARRCAVNYERGAVRRLDFPRFVHAAGGLCSSLEDLVRWNLALDAGRVLPPELAKEMWTRARLNDGSAVQIGGPTTGYGLGWVVDDAPGHKAVGHSGGNSTGYRRYLDDRMTIIVLHNGVLDPDGLITSIAAIVQREAGDSGPTAQERLWDASMTGDTAEIARALDDGADVEALDTRKSRNGRRALNWAAVNDRPEAVRLLLARGAAIDASNKTGFTALHHAAESGATEVVALLLASGANPALPNRDGERPAEIARRHGHTAIAQAIAAAGKK